MLHQIHHCTHITHQMALPTSLLNKSQLPLEVQLDLWASTQHPTQKTLVPARALQVGGAMALFTAGIDPVNIRLQGQWKSWAMMEYLHKI